MIPIEHQILLNHCRHLGVLHLILINCLHTSQIETNEFWELWDGIFREGSQFMDDPEDRKLGDGSQALDGTEGFVFVECDWALKGTVGSIFEEGSWVVDGTAYFMFGE